MIIQKFGGSSVADSICFNRVFDIITQDSPSKYIVVSATKGTTNQLISLTKLENLNKTDDLLKDILDNHLKIIKELELQNESFLQYFNKHAIEIKSILNSIRVLKNSSPLKITEIISSYGELWSSFILTQLLNKNNINAKQIDARTFLTVKEKDDQVFVDYEKSKSEIKKVIDDNAYNIITGYLAKDENGSPTTLKRNGSDLTASVVSNLLNAEKVIIWTDVDGVYTSDPRFITLAKKIKELSYDEAIELAHFGANVLHPQTMTPVINKEIPIEIKSTFYPKEKGSLIKKIPENGDLVKGFSVMDDVSLFNIEGSLLVGTPGIASKIFAKLKDEGISVILITQGSSEYSITFMIKKDSAEDAKSSLNSFFNLEISKGLLGEIKYSNDFDLLAVVGDKMSNVSGLSGKVFSALGNNNINIKAISQGSSERNISIVVNKEDSNQALNSLHQEFFYEKEYNIALIGAGSVGSEFLSQLSLLNQNNINVKAICNSKKMSLGNNLNIDLFDNDNESVDLNKMVSFLTKDQSKRNIIIDCTASEKISNFYLEWMDKGIHVITPNKKANTQSLDYYHNINNHKSKFFYETTVGAGLPVLNTLKGLLNSGDKINKIEGVFSGTLSYIFNNYKDSYSSIVNEAYSKGYTEPHPRDDLSGMDVARKALILSREIGGEFNLDDIKIEKLYVDSLDNDGVDEFLSKIKRCDSMIHEKIEKDSVLRYIATITNDKITTELKSVKKDHPFYNLAGTDNIIAFYTDRYNNTPLVVKGPGAGVEVTASGILSDLIQLMKEI